MVGTSGINAEGYDDVSKKKIPLDQLIKKLNYYHCYYSDCDYVCVNMEG